MSNYVLFLGGTGARCAEAFAYLSACGAIACEGQTYVLLCDSDQGNGNFVRAQQVYGQYQALRRQFCRGRLGEKASPFLNNDLSAATWVITMGSESTFRLSQLNGGDPASQRVMDALYRREDSSEIISNLGFFARPAIGAAAMRAILLADRGNAYAAMKEQIRQDLAVGPVRILLVGSVFGGTGASALPAIAYDLSEWLGQDKHLRKNATLGGLLMLPYFSFVKDIQRSQPERRIKAEDFLPACKRALEYYNEHARLRSPGDQETDTGLFDQLYLLGMPGLFSVLEQDAGSSGQKNDAMLPEWESALAAFSFFTQPEARLRPPQSYVKWIREKDRDGLYPLSWPDFSMTGLDAYIEQMLLFSLIWQSHYKPQITGYLTGRDKYVKNYYKYLVAGYLKQAPGREAEDFQPLNQLTHGFLLWLQQSLDGRQVLRQELIHPNSLPLVASGDKDPQYTRRWKPILQTLPGRDKPEILNQVDQAFDYRPEMYEDPADNCGLFLHTLYSACRSRRA